MRSARMLCVAALVALGAAGCQTAPERPAAGEVAEYRYPAQRYQPGAPDNARLYRLDAEASTVRVLVYRGGTLAAAGHNHVVVPGQLRGAVWLPQGALDGVRMDIAVPLESLRVDPEDDRAAIGGSFAAGVDDEARRGTRRNMLGPDGLDAARFPLLGLRVQGAAGELPRPVLQLQVYLHGRRHDVTVPAAVTVDGERLRARGRFAIRQSWFGIEPFSALGGALRVQDWLTVEFDVVARAESG